jgi:hypothetical protein
MHYFLARQRKAALLVYLRAMAPSISIAFIAERLAFREVSECLDFLRRLGAVVVSTMESVPTTADGSTGAGGDDCVMSSVVVHSVDCKASLTKIASLGSFVASSSSSSSSTSCSSSSSRGALKVAPAGQQQQQQRGSGGAVGGGGGGGGGGGLSTGRDRPAEASQQQKRKQQKSAGKHDKKEKKKEKKHDKSIKKEEKVSAVASVYSGLSASR